MENIIFPILLYMTLILFLFTFVSVLMLLYSSGISRTAIEPKEAEILKYGARKKEVAKKAVEEFLLLREERK